MKIDNSYPVKDKVPKIALEIARVMGKAKYFTPLFQRKVRVEQRKSLYNSLYRFVELERTIEQSERDYQLTKQSNVDGSQMEQLQIYFNTLNKHKEHLSNLNIEVKEISKELQKYLDLDEFRNRRKFLHHLSAWLSKAIYFH
jgi:hypothetical protein